MQTLFDTHIQTRIASNLPFAVYRFPDDGHIELTDFASARPFRFSFFDDRPDDCGFVVYPFDCRNENGWWFPVKKVSCFDQSDFCSIPASQHGYSAHQESTAEYMDYKNRFNKLQKEFAAGQLKKAILSRTISHRGDIRPQLSLLFAQMCMNYSDAFICLLSTAETGIWACASPELLLKKDDDGRYTTVALAGTKHTQGAAGMWSVKEFEEQEIVSDYIDRLLHDSDARNCLKDGPSAVRAGTVTHLKTVYRFELPPQTGGTGNFIRALHPTPALAGEPKQEAMDAIRRTEPHSRRYYGGFIGTVSGQRITLYVNIRCVNIQPDCALIYAGGGLTQRSDVNDEWRETELKAKTMLNIIGLLHGSCESTDV